MRWQWVRDAQSSGLKEVEDFESLNSAPLAVAPSLYLHYPATRSLPWAPKRRCWTLKQFCITLLIALVLNPVCLFAQKASRPLTIEEQEICIAVAQDQLILNPFARRFNLTEMNQRIRAVLRRSPGNRGIRIKSAALIQRNGRRLLGLQCLSSDGASKKFEYELRDYEDPLFPSEHMVINADGKKEFPSTALSMAHVVYLDWEGNNFPPNFKPNLKLFERFNSKTVAQARPLKLKIFVSGNVKVIVIASQRSKESIEYRVQRNGEGWNLMRVTLNSNGRKRSIIPYRKS
jgi:hypothetical protein